MLLSETSVYETDNGAELLIEGDLSGLSAPRDQFVQELDDKRGGVRFSDDDTETYQSVRNARLMLGLWLDYGPFPDETSTQQVPVSIAVAGKGPLAAYLYLGLDRGRTRSRAQVRELLDVERRQTVTNYLSDVRLPWGEIIN